MRRLCLRSCRRSHAMWGWHQDVTRHQPAFPAPHAPPCFIRDSASPAKACSMRQSKSSSLCRSSRPAHHTMPGLLDTKGFQFYSLKFAIAVTAEMIGVLVFAFYSSSAPSEYAAWANGLSLAVAGRDDVFLVYCKILSRQMLATEVSKSGAPAVYITANISGGHLNPAVTVATVCTGHISLLKAAAYIVAQVVGAILAHLIQASCCMPPSVRLCYKGPHVCWRRRTGL